MPDMAADEALLRRLRDRLAETDEVIEKPMVGGIGFLWHGNLLCGVMGDELLIRVEANLAAEFEGDGGAHPMVMAGRRAKSWLLVPAAAVRSDTGLTTWLDRAFAYVVTLPPK
jgi:TfoX/Sxy family transcriptional regulator of competence genes